MPFLLIVLFIVVPIAELAVLIQIGQLIGVWWTIALLVVDAILGSLLARSQGRSVWRRFNEAIGAGRVRVAEPPPMSPRLPVPRPVGRGPYLAAASCWSVAQLGGERAGGALRR